ncbi:MAG: HlyC/CorC family transporter [Saprospiraceae bacterium]|jgi:CBS domain containing-hemolysin-like protein|nr:HlyC/CorC family transporter [Saprospiraceae bacterium]MBL0024384.1 HlyC/CorC family transporter [Saprospiraceae bacterium]
MVTTLIFVLITIILSGFFSGTEIAYLSANKLSIEVLKNKGSKKGQILTDLYKDPKSFLSTMLVGNNVVLVMYTILFSSVITPLVEMLLPSGSISASLVTTIILTIVILIFGEFLPKTIFRLYANELIFRLAHPLRFFSWLLLIPSWILTKTSNLIIRLVIGNVEVADDNNITKLDLEHYIHSNVHEEKEIDKEILTNALNLNLLKVRDCMVPRNEMMFVDKNDDLQTVKETFISSKHSRLIVIDGDVENVIGYFHHQQLFKNITSLKRNIMDIDFVPDVMNVQDLMYKFIKNSTNIACVVDEFGSTAGIITLEDILEEIFGEIADEHDEEDYTEKMISDDEYIFSGRLELGYLNDKYEHLNLPEKEYVTLSGYIVMTHGSIPEVGETIELDNYKFEILTKSDTKIDEVKVIKISDHKDLISES